MILIIIILLYVQISSASTENISIIDPDAGSLLDNNFDINVKITDPSVTTAYVKVIGMVWQPLDRISETVWSTTLNISTISDGAHTLTAKYQDNTNTYFYVAQTTPVMVQKIIPATIYGQIEFTVNNADAKPLQDAIITPTGQRTNSAGILLLQNLTLNQDYNFSITKDDYRSAYYTYRFQDATKVTKTIQLNLTNPPKSKLKIFGFDDFVELTSSYYIKVLDSKTDEAIEEAEVKVYDMGGRVISLAGNTSKSGRLLVGFNSPGIYYLGIEKAGYEYLETDEIQVLAPKPTPTPVPTPTPTVVPTPVPTIEKKQYDEMKNSTFDGLATADEYRAFLAQKEIERLKANTTNSSTIIYTQPPQDNTLWWLGGIGAVILGIVYLRNKPEQNKTPTYKLRGREADELDHIPEIIQKGIMVKCDLCDWHTEVGLDIDSSIQKAIIESHKTRPVSAGGHGKEKTE